MPKRKMSHVTEKFPESGRVLSQDVYIVFTRKDLERIKVTSVFLNCFKNVKTLKLDIKSDINVGPFKSKKHGLCTGCLTTLDT